MEISQNFVAFSEYMNFTTENSTSIAFLFESELFTSSKLNPFGQNLIMMRSSFVLTYLELMYQNTQDTEI